MCVELNWIWTTRIVYRVLYDQTVTNTRVGLDLDDPVDGAGDVLRLLPPLVVTAEEVDQAVAIIAEAMKDL